MADTDRNKQVVRRYVDEVWNAHRLEVHDELVAPEFEIANTGYAPHKDGEKEFIEAHRRAFPDMRYRILNMIAEGDEVSATIQGKGTHRGEWMGQAPTGNQVTVNGNATFTIKDGKIVKSVHNVDLLGLRIDIGLVNEQQVLPGNITRPTLA
jgi:predicted ester cyclase